jgi:membrane associated rhomboid family serine protease
MIPWTRCVPIFGPALKRGEASSFGQWTVQFRELICTEFFIRFHQNHINHHVEELRMTCQVWRFFTFTFFHLQFLDLFQNLLTLLDTLDVEAWFWRDFRDG